jgi:2-polyprenyl-6-methoxyphenol hydroxylase-like FAD-dependent oxidoreductase
VSGLRVAVAGGGLGGLGLAQGLLKADVDVTVYERDAQPAGRRQGYRLHVDARRAGPGAVPYSWLPCAVPGHLR